MFTMIFTEIKQLRKGLGYIEISNLQHLKADSPGGYFRAGLWVCDQAPLASQCLKGHRFADFSIWPLCFGCAPTFTNRHSCRCRVPTLGMQGMVCMTLNITLEISTETWCTAGTMQNTWDYLLIHTRSHLFSWFNWGDEQCDALSKTNFSRIHDANYFQPMQVHHV